MLEEGPGQGVSGDDLTGDYLTTVSCFSQFQKYRTSNPLCCFRDFKPEKFVNSEFPSSRWIGLTSKSLNDSVWTLQLMSGISYFFAGFPSLANNREDLVNPF